MGLSYFHINQSLRKVHLLRKRSLQQAMRKQKLHPYRTSNCLLGLPPVPLLFQDGILHRIFIPGCAVWIVYKGDEFQEHALPAHAQLLAQVLTGKIIVLGVG